MHNLLKIIKISDQVLKSHIILKFLQLHRLKSLKISDLFLISKYGALEPTVFGIG